MNISFSRLPSNTVNLLTLNKISLSIENRRSAAILDGMAVLYLVKRSIKTYSRQKGDFSQNLFQDDLQSGFHSVLRLKFQ